ncbi:hypothetical protein I79_004466 [Cricetulus griseus]|uniref:Uncharacterized protein n=1 Tax=Cricetulus griseus TaxID=10029 RepID=G3H2P8_CRIGR|nr:hypothetical protein I79_004466 [Cricetulus griseus]
MPSVSVQSNTMSACRATCHHDDNGLDPLSHKPSHAFLCKSCCGHDISAQQ